MRGKTIKQSINDERIKPSVDLYITTFCADCGEKMSISIDVFDIETTPEIDPNATATPQPAEHLRIDLDINADLCEACREQMQEDHDSEIDDLKEKHNDTVSELEDQIEDQQKIIESGIHVKREDIEEVIRLQQV